MLWCIVLYLRVLIKSMKYLISGIQQMGIGVPDVETAFKFYRKYFGNDIKIFEDAAQAPLMIRYTGNNVESRTATLAINMNGGGGFEIWQFTSRETKKPTFDIMTGDTGIYITKIKSRDVRATYDFFKRSGVNTAGELTNDPNGHPHFYLRDPYDNLFEIVSFDNWFGETKNLCGGAAGAVIGVSDMEKSLKFYADILGYDQVLYDQSGAFDDLGALPGGKRKFRRVLLRHSVPRSGPFSELLGESQLELIQLLEEKGRKIFENRYWGDWGFIHLCYDIKGMTALRETCEKGGYPFTVDSGDTFDMGEAGGQFSYVEDPDGTLIEFVETHRIPVMKKLGWYMNLNKRPANKPLPRWMVKALRFNRVKD